jgi:hypothetical protein
MIKSAPEKSMKKTTSLALSVAVLAAFVSFAKDTPKANPFTEVLATVPSAELPAKAADVVQHAKNRERTDVTVEVVKAALGINPAAAPAVVGAIASAVPTVASVAAGVAASEQPKQAPAIAKAAAAAAPAQARRIVLAVCRAVPNAYRDIAVAVSQAVPTANKEILSAVSAAIPGLKPYIEQALIGYGGNAPSVTSVLDQAASLAQATSAPGAISTVAGTPTSGSTANSSQPIAAGTPGLAGASVRGPAIGPPYIALQGTPTNVTSGTSGEVPTGGRDYARP